jgi:hypothetical protein
MYLLIFESSLWCGGRTGSRPLTRSIDRKNRKLFTKKFSVRPIFSWTESQNLKLKEYPLATNAVAFRQLPDDALSCMLHRTEGPTSKDQTSTNKEEK